MHIENAIETLEMIKKYMEEPDSKFAITCLNSFINELKTSVITPPEDIKDVDFFELYINIKIAYEASKNIKNLIPDKLWQFELSEDARYFYETALSAANGAVKELENIEGDIFELDEKYKNYSTEGVIRIKSKDLIVK